ncbi:programmed cell death protein 4 [Octopus bimaculoides]|uniref:Programmed cell death protein 4 n=1 Tax=Octopus bimaculoides TaxID=37653 RepID=A0A0L8HTP0_OCTBM|nr:programmed cell death protein 4 [Octopus bimaculoides]|eukprot:XP_014769416.1 PREDICTED: programmed cell death protein 4-like [Octopus bimaculoides]
MALVETVRGYEHSEDLINGNVDDRCKDVDDEEAEEHMKLDNIKPLRIIRKAKRPSKAVEGHGHLQNGGGSSTGTLINTGNRLAFSKNSRRSRNGKGRGLPKKGGGGGKGTWGLPGEELYEDGICTDVRDPNYDPESQDEYIVEETEPEIDDEQVTKLVEPILLEYFEHGDTGDFKDSLEDLNMSKYTPQIAEMAINLALDRKGLQREMTSVLISDLYGDYLSHEDIANGFDNVLRSLSELTLDAPEAPLVVGQFIARAVADDCLPPKFVSSYKGKVDCPHAREALDKADILLTMKHGIVRLDTVWGTGGGVRPVKFLVKQIVLLLKEYMSSGDIAEATRCLQELDVPHFHHELVYEATVMVLEDSSDRAAEMMCKLLKSLCVAVIITPEQMSQGFRRVYEAMPDICLDVPAAYTILEKFATMCFKSGVLSRELYQELPQRGRKRFVSEGDGGRIKDSQN